MIRAMSWVSRAGGRFPGENQLWGERWTLRLSVTDECIMLMNERNVSRAELTTAYFA